MEATERDSACVVARELLDRSVDLLPNTLDAWCDSELRRSACHDEREQRDAPNPGVHAGARPIECERQHRHGDSGKEKYGKDAPDERACERATRQHGERRGRHDSREQDAGA